ncbi:MAG TPA: ChrR family anti-sigma-E factor [Oleiagrimonas sp.]|nr:ChrR family anti-sigma-E factor [Oleiagrimonas sp.]
MKPQHHLDPATLVSYAAGAMTGAMAVVAAAHLEACEHCRQVLAEAERLGGVLLDQQAPRADELARAAALREHMLSRIGAAKSGVATSGTRIVDAALRTCADNIGDTLPRALHPYFGTSLHRLKWRWIAPGMHFMHARNVSHGKLFMLKIAPGKSMPTHGHHGNELTQVLQGAYDDGLGHFAVGDMADLDADIRHQPITASGPPCICVAALDAPLHFPGWFARALQPLVGL